ncbi:Two-component response regulator ORR24, partial [Linum grandiflorum]
LINNSDLKKDKSTNFAATKSLKLRTLGFLVVSLVCSPPNHFMETDQTTTPVVHVEDKGKNKSNDFNIDEDNHHHHGQLLASEFPDGLKVLLVDDDQTCLLILRQMLHRCTFQVVSSDDDQRLVMEGILGDACDYLIKPITMNNIKTIWQHVVRRKNSKALKDNNQHVVRVGSPHPLMNNSSILQAENHNNGATGSSGTTTIVKKSNNDDQLGGGDDGSGSNEEDNGQQEEAGTKGKKRMVWTQDLHDKFLRAINFLGTSSNIVPTKILECMLRMGVEGITRENVASHLQKYRMQLRRQEEQHHELSFSSSPNYHHQIHQPFTVGSWGSSTSAPPAIHMTVTDELDHNATFGHATTLVDHHHHQINNNNHHQINNTNNPNFSNLYNSGSFVYTQPNIDTSESLPINIPAASHELLGGDPYFNLQNQFGYHQMGGFHEAYSEVQNMANDALGNEDYTENSLQFYQYS